MLSCLPLWMYNYCIGRKAVLDAINRKIMNTVKKTRASFRSLQFNYEKLLRGKLEKWRDLKIFSRIFTMEFISRKKEGKENKENKYLFSILHNCRITNYCETFLSLLTHGKLFYSLLQPSRVTFQRKIKKNGRI